VGPRTGLDLAAKIKIPAPACDRTPISQPVTSHFMADLSQLLFFLKERQILKRGLKIILKDVALIVFMFSFIQERFHLFICRS
jgi:hypothetical protein